MTTKLRILAPAAIVFGALAIHVSEHAPLILVFGVTTVVATWAAIELWIQRPLESLTGLTRAALAGDTEHTPAPTLGMLEPLGRSILELRDTLSRTLDQRTAEAEERRRAEQVAREHEERYALAIQGTDDGLWEWNLRTDSVWYSPRWKAMLGHADEAIGQSIDEWRDRIHPEDRAAALGRLDAHLKGETARYESEHRLCGRDGRYRWVLVRGAALHAAGGRPVRFVALSTDINERKRVEEILSALSAGLAEVRGDRFFAALARNLAVALGVEQAFVAECADAAKSRARVLASWCAGTLTGGDEYAIEGAPCEIVIGERRICVYPRDVGKRFPREAGFESYVGFPMLDSHGAVIGHLVALDKRPLAEPLPLELIFSLFAVRASLELERRQLAERLRSKA